MSSEKWKRAVVHLECAADREHLLDLGKRMAALREQLEQGTITQEIFEQVRAAPLGRDRRSQGTALFLEDGGKRYLVTARHVLWDEKSARRELQEEVDRAPSLPDAMRASQLQIAAEVASNRIFSIIFRVPKLDEFLDGSRDPLQHDEFLMNLAAGGYWRAPYTFSDQFDLAVVSVDARRRIFGDDLLSKGFTPVSIDDLADGPTAEGAEVFTVGYPAATAVIGKIDQHPALAHWSSSHFSQPAYAYGKVSMLHDALPYFWADMSIYPGNSGGPVVENDQLVGIVSAQPTVAVTDINDAAQEIGRARIPFGKIIKAANIRPLLDLQKQKDSQH